VLDAIEGHQLRSRVVGRVEKLPDDCGVKPFLFQQLGQGARARRQLLAHHLPIVPYARAERSQAAEKRRAGGIAGNGLHVRAIESHRRLREAIKVGCLAEGVAIAAPHARVAVLDDHEEDVHSRGIRQTDSARRRVRPWWAKGGGKQTDRQKGMLGRSLSGFHNFEQCRIHLFPARERAHAP
jgi:hypothetical protein